MNIQSIRQWTLITDKKSVSREYANRICDDVVRLIYESVAGDRVFWSNQQVQLVGKIYYTGLLRYEKSIVAHIHSVERLMDDDDGNPVLCFWLENGTRYKARQDAMAENMLKKLLGGVEAWKGDPYLEL